MHATRSATLLTLTIVAILAVVDCVALARQATVTMKDGRKLTGEVVSDDSGGVTLRISEIDTPIARDQIDSVTYLKSIEEQYHERRAQLADNNLEDRYQLAVWLDDQKAYPLAKQELDDLARRFPDDARVTLLRRMVDQKIKLAQESAAKPAHAPVAPKPVILAPTASTTETKPRLTHEQVNLIKVYEIDPADQPRVNVPEDVLNNLFKNHSDNDAVPKGRDDQAALRAAPGWQQLDVIFKAHARELYPKIKVMDDPGAIRVFKTSIHRNYVINYCATANCHGGDHAGPVFFFRTEPDTDKTVYTNFYILQHTTDSKGYFALDLSKPEESLLAQYGLPRASAAHPHPDLPGWRPRFASPSDPRYQLIIDWVKSLGSVPANYPMSYAVPHGPPTAGSTQPAPPTQESP